MNFSRLGLGFGTGFTAFYLLIGHFWGAGCVLACTVALVATRGLLTSPERLTLAGNLNALVLTTGFVVLTSLEGGLHGHAVAWLACVPLCACLFVGRRAGWFWCGCCLLAVSVFGALALAGVPLPSLCPARWQPLVSVAGYVSLTLFMCMLGLVHEETRRQGWRRLEAALAQAAAAQEELRRLSEQRGEFVNIAAHDLRNPLNALNGYLQMAQLELVSADFPGVVAAAPGGNGGAADPPRPLELSVERGARLNRALAQIEAATLRMRELLDKLLCARSIEEGRLPVTPQRCRLDALARAALELHGAQAARKRITLIWDGASAPAWVDADPELLRQILDNLLSNALKYSPPGCPVTLRIRRPAAAAPSSPPPAPGLAGPASRAAGDATLSRVTVEVEDRGPGISEADQAQLFKKFSCLPARPTAGESSHGLGLAIAHQLAELCGAQLTCHSQPGRGSTFALTLREAGEDAAWSDRVGAASLPLAN